MQAAQSMRAVQNEVQYETSEQEPLLYLVMICEKVTISAARMQAPKSDQVQ